MITKESQLRQIFNAIRDSNDSSGTRGHLLEAVREIPKSPEYLELFKLGFGLLDKIADPADKGIATIDFAKEVPSTSVFVPLYSAAMEAAIDAADTLEETHHRLTELIRLANELPRTDEFTSLRLHAWRLALGLSDKPRFREPDLEKVSRELPKNVDEAFYRRYTLMGVSKEMPKDGAFLNLYREGIQLAIKASGKVSEPYYRKYALVFIANDLPKTPELADLRRLAISEAYKAAKEIKDPFAREHALIDILQMAPKTHDFLTLLQE